MSWIGRRYWALPSYAESTGPRPCARLAPSSPLPGIMNTAAPAHSSVWVTAQGWPHSLPPSMQKALHSAAVETSMWGPAVNVPWLLPVKSILHSGIHTEAFTIAAALRVHLVQKVVWTELWPSVEAFVQSWRISREGAEKYILRSLLLKSPACSSISQIRA